MDTQTCNFPKKIQSDSSNSLSEGVRLFLLVQENIHQSQNSRKPRQKIWIERYLCCFPFVLNSLADSTNKITSEWGMKKKESDTNLWISQQHTNNLPLPRKLLLCPINVRQLHGNTDTSISWKTFSFSLY